MHHHQIIATTAMDSESQMASDHNAFPGSGGTASHQGGAVGGVSVADSWVDMSPYTQTTMPDFSNYTFNAPTLSNHGLPSESLSRMAPPPLPPPPPSVEQHQPHGHPNHQAHPQLHPLIMPSNPTWPSMLTNPSSFSAHSAHSVHSAHSAPAMILPPPIGAQLKTSKVSTQPTPRKTLTDANRRDLCQFAMDNPGMKQTEIGKRFGVERSTVSKVLRNKDKYLNQDDRSSSPGKRSKRGTVDIEKALLNWLRNKQKEGRPVTDEEIREKAQVFAENTSATPDGLAKLSSSTTWLEKFKQKHGIGVPKLLRRASETNIHSSSSHYGMTSASPLMGPSNAPDSATALSPNSPHGQVHLSPSPLSANPNRSDEEKDGGATGAGGAGAFMEFNSESGAYRHSHNQSSTSLSSAFTDTAASSFSGSTMSPTPFNFTPDSAVGSAFMADVANRHISPGSSGFQRPRSQTFPTLDIELMNQPHTTEPLTPKFHHGSATAPSSTLESPMNEMMSQPFAIDTSVASARPVVSPHLHRSSSNSSLAPRSTGTPAPASGAVASTPVGSSPNSPTQEDARRAADTLLSFMKQNMAGSLDHDDFIAVIRLTEKLRLYQHQLANAAAAGNVPGMGGLSRIPEGEVEMTNAPPVTMARLEPTTMSA